MPHRVGVKTYIHDGRHLSRNCQSVVRTLCNPFMSYGQDFEAVAISVDGHI